MEPAVVLNFQAANVVKSILANSDYLISYL